MSPHKYQFMVYAVDPRTTSICPRVCFEKSRAEVESFTPQGLMIMLAQAALDYGTPKPIEAVLWVNLCYCVNRERHSVLAEDFPVYLQKFPEGLVAVELEQISINTPWRASRVRV